MLFLLQSLAAWAAAALALGFAIGLLACGRPRRPGWSFAELLLALLYSCGLVAAMLDLAPGRYGFWLETGLMMFTAYAVGGFGGCALRRLFRPRAAPRAPEWIGATTPVLDQARSFAAAAPEALRALESAELFFARTSVVVPRKAPERERVITSAFAAPAELVAEEPAREDATPEGKGELRLVHGLDRNSARALRRCGPVTLAAFASWSPPRRAEVATRLGLDEAVVSYWTAQARLLVHGVATEFSQASDQAAEAEGAPLDGVTAQALSAALPQVVAPQTSDGFYPGERPLGLLAPPSGEQHDLGRIPGIDAEAAKRLNALGIWTFSQIAAWTPDNARWVDSYLAAPGRIGREHWVERAAALGRGASVTT